MRSCVSQPGLLRFQKEIGRNGPAVALNAIPSWKTIDTAEL